MTSLENARERVMRRRWAGTVCPCCDQFAKVYRRTLNAQMARALILMWREGGENWVHMPTVLSGRRADEAKLRYWDLIEEELETNRAEGRSGWWRVTSKGAAFSQGYATVPKYVYVYDGIPLQLDGPQVGVVEALGTRFDYRDLMRAVPINVSA